MMPEFKMVNFRDKFDSGSGLISQSTVYFKSCKYLIKWPKYCFKAKRMKLIFGQFHNFTIECTKLTSSSCHVAA